MVNDGGLIIISGPSGVGKSSIIKELLDRDKCFRFVTPITTRKIRKGEVDGDDYDFLSRKEFQELIKHNKLYEWDYVLDNYYGFKTNAFLMNNGKIGVTHALAKMALRIKAKRRNVITIFLKPSNNLIVKDRLMDREEEKEIKERIKHGVDELAHQSIFDYIIEEIELNNFVDEIVKIIQDNKSFNTDWLIRCAHKPSG